MDVRVQLLRQKDLPCWVFPEGHNPLLTPEEIAAAAEAAKAKAAAEEQSAVAGGAAAALEGLKGVDEDKLAQLLAEALQKEANAANPNKMAGKSDVSVAVKQEVKLEGELKEEVKDEAKQAQGLIKLEETSQGLGIVPGPVGIKRPAQEDELDAEDKKRRMRKQESPQLSIDDLNTEVGGCGNTLYLKIEI